MKKQVVLFVLAFSLLLSGTESSTGANKPKEKSPPTPRATTPYLLDNSAFADKLAKAKDEDEKLAVLEKKWEAVTRAVSFCNVAGHGPGFHSSSMYWQSGYSGGETNEQKAHLTEPLEIEKGAIIIRGDCRADITVKGNAFVHIYGDLDAKITTVGKAQSEIVIGGDITQNGTLDTAYITQIFVGGNVDGDIKCNGSSFITWINGDLNGTIFTGRPGSAVHIMGDFNGSMRHLEEASPSSASLDVRGFMSEEKIKAVTQESYIQFEASIGYSDMPAGLYPKPKPRSHTNSRWVVHAQLH